MSPIKIFLNETERLKSVLLNAKLAKLDKEELVFELNESSKVKKSSTVEDLESEPVVEGQKIKQCLTCKTIFENRVEQVTHYKSNYHSYNIKLKLSKRETLTLDQFNNLQDDVSSISGSDTSDYSNSENETKFPSVPLYSNSDSEKEYKNDQFGNRLPKFYLENENKDIISFYKKLVFSKESDKLDGNIYQQSLDVLQSAYDQIWTLVLFNGNHFAAAAFKGNQPLVHKTFHSYVVRAKRGTAQSVNDSQNKNNQAKSAGSSLRRHNEQSQLKSIEDLLNSWKKDYLDASTLIFIRIPVYKKGFFFGGRNPILSPKDPRIRKVPFSTRRPTHNELIRVHSELYSVTLYNKTSVSKIFANKPTSNVLKSKEKVQNNKKQYDRSDCRHRKKKKQQETYSTPSTTKVLQEEEENHLKFIQEIVATNHLSDFEISSNIKKKNKKKLQKEKNRESQVLPNDDDDGKQEEDSEIEKTKIKENDKKEKRQKKVMKKFQLFEKLTESEKNLLNLLYTSCKIEDVTATEQLLTQKFTSSSTKVAQSSIPDLLSQYIDTEGNTLLHLASRSGNTTLIELLLDHGADPSKRNLKSFLPYNITPNKKTKNFYRKYRGKHPDKYDYQKAEIPTALYEENEKEVLEKRRLKRAAQRQKNKLKKEEIKIAKEKQDEKERFDKMSDREKRLLAIEKRMQEQSITPSAASITSEACQLCSQSLFAQIPFKYFDYSFCSINCLKSHKKSLSH